MKNNNVLKDSSLLNPDINRIKPKFKVLNSDFAALWCSECVYSELLDGGHIKCHLDGAVFGRWQHTGCYSPYLFKPLSEDQIINEQLEFAF